MNLEEEVERLSIGYPYHVGSLGTSINDIQDTQLLVENNIVVMPGINMAVHCYFAAYYVFGINYPAPTQNIFL